MVKQSRAVQEVQFCLRNFDVQPVEVSRHDLRVSLRGVKRTMSKEYYKHTKLEGDRPAQDAIKLRLKKLRRIVKDLERAILMSYN
jgi:hypothetical protein